jgi:ankyrin repeat protein
LLAAADPQRTQAFMTPLHHAARSGHAKVARLLLQRNADVVRAKTLARTARAANPSAAER